MHNTLRVLQLNVRKQTTVQQSLMNDVQLREFGVLAISEPHAVSSDATGTTGLILTSPMGHANWSRMVPTTQHAGRWKVRSMLWIRKDIEAEQVPVQSADLMAAVLRLPDRVV